MINKRVSSIEVTNLAKFTILAITITLSKTGVGNLRLRSHMRFFEPPVVAPVRGKQRPFFRNPFRNNWFLDLTVVLRLPLGFAL